MEEILQQGAEAILIRKESLVQKKRIAKGYRLPILDERIRKLRTRSEAKLLERAGKVVPTPKVVTVREKETEIDMEYLEGLKLSEHLDTLKNAGAVCNQIGTTIALLHDADIIHGDLTTSNMIYIEGEDKVYFIDFGLGYSSVKAEDKAVDLHLIRQALEAKHFLHFEVFWNEILRGYRESSKRGDEILKRLERVEKRGRYKEQY